MNRLKETKTLRTLRQRMAELGLTVIDTKMGGGGHYKFRARCGDIEKTVIGPRTMGDWRIERNWVAQLRKAFSL